MSKLSDHQLQSHRVVSPQEWLAARTAFLAAEKAFSRQREALARQRRALPWVRVDKPYVFEAPGGRVSLADLFESRRQLVVYHFMFKPEASAGCSHCSFWADHYSGMIPHLKQRDVSFVAVARAPLPQIEAFRRRMGWSFNWVSSGGSDFNFDFQVSFTPAQLASGTVFYNYAPTAAGPADREGLSVFYRDDGGAVYHTYSCYARGIDMVNGTYQILDLVPKGRDEAPGAAQDWVRYHDQY
jgi:predicted dithiol-disulfide oxidoreductase (DUF899 family)